MRQESARGPATDTSSSPAPRRGAAATWTWRAAQLLLTAVVTWAIVRQVGLGLDDIRGLDPSWWRPNIGLAAAASLVLVLGYFMSAGLWGLMVRELGGTAIPPWRGVRIFMTANLARYVPGKVWQIAGLALLARREGVSPVVATGSAVLGQAVALMGATLVGAGALLSAGGAVRQWGWVALVGLGAVTLVASVPGVATRPDPAGQSPRTGRHRRPRSP